MWRPGMEHSHTVWWQPLIYNRTKILIFPLDGDGAGIKELNWFCWGGQWEETLKSKPQEHIQTLYPLKDESTPPPTTPSIPLSSYLCLQTWYPSGPRFVWLSFCAPAKNISTHILLSWSPTLSALIYCTLPCWGNKQGFPSLSRDELFLTLCTLLTAQLTLKHRMPPCQRC